MGIINKSFTLIELIIAVGVTALILPAVFAIFFAIMRQQLVLTSYQTIKQEGDSIQRNITTLLGQRAASITDSSYSSPTQEEICPLLTTPTPTFSPEIYTVDRAGNHIHFFPIPTSPSVIYIASASASKTYLLSSEAVSVVDLGFSCHRITEFAPPVVQVAYSVQKSTQYADIFLPYAFSVRLKNY